MKGTVVQLGSSMILALLTFKLTFANVWPSYATPMLQSEDSPLGFPISDLQVNIISSIPMLASIISTLLTGYISEALGRKRTQILCALIFLTSWTLIATARSVIQIIIGRFIIGLSGGMALVSVVIYISEITSLSNRGSGTTVVSLFNNLGIMTSYLLGWFLRYDVICYVCMTGTLVFVILMVCLKESPSWLIKCGRDKTSATSMMLKTRPQFISIFLILLLTGPIVVSLFNNLGIMTLYLLGWFLRYDVICYVCMTGTLVFVILMVCLKESPSWLIKCGRDKEALVALKFYRGKSETTEAILEELSYLKSQAHYNPGSGNTGKYDTSQENFHEKHDDLEKKNPWIQLVTIDYNRRALITSVMFMVLVTLTGMIAVQTYAIQFFSKAIPTISPNLSSVLLALVLILTSCVTILVTDLVTRRTLMISTASTTTICLIFLGSAMRWPEIPVWVAPVAVVVYCIAYQLGLINIVLIQISESFGPQVNSAAAAIVICFMFATNFVLLFCFGPAVAYFGIDVTFFIFAAIGAVMTVLTILFMKETRWVPVEDVQRMFAKGFLCRRLQDL